MPSAVTEKITKTKPILRLNARERELLAGSPRCLVCRRAEFEIQGAWGAHQVCGPCFNAAMQVAKLHREFLGRKLSRRAMACFTREVGAFLLLSDAEFAAVEEGGSR